MLINRNVGVICKNFLKCCIQTPVMLKFSILLFLGMSVSSMIILSGNPVSAELIRGTNDADVFQATNDDDQIIALGGNDDFNALDGDDKISAGLGDDDVKGGGGNDEIRGDQGSDDINGDGDFVSDGVGVDRLFGGPGDDRLMHSNTDEDRTAPDGFKDTLDCGPGDDEAWINVNTDHDVVKNCETIHDETG